MQKILLIHPDITILDRLKKELEKRILNVAVLTAQTLFESNQALRHNQKNISIAIVDIDLQDSSPGKAVMLTSTHNIPTIVISSAQDKSLQELLRKKNVLDYIDKDSKNSISSTVDLVAQTLRNYNKTILVVDDSKLFRNTFQEDLKKLHINVITACDGAEAFDIVDSLEGENISIVLTDYNMPNMDGIELTMKLREKYQKDRLSIIAISATDDEEALTKFIKAGANDFLSKPYKFTELKVRIGANLDLLELFQKATDLANKDFLTGAYNRRYFFEASKAIIDKNYRKNASIAVATIDIDKFKNINDTYGHDIGDIALKESLVVLNKRLRQSDLLARFGGEEFCILLEDISLEDTKDLFEDMREKFENNEISIDGIIIKYTVSIGVAYKKSFDIDEMLKISDNALYEAKNTGRNKVIIHTA